MTYQTKSKLRIRGINQTAVYVILAIAAASTLSLPFLFDLSDRSTLPVFFAVYSAAMAIIVGVLIHALMYIPWFGTNLAIIGNESIQIGYRTYQFEEIDHLKIATTTWHSVDFEITFNGIRTPIHLDLPESQSALESFQEILIAIDGQLCDNFEASGSIVGQVDA